MEISQAFRLGYKTKLSALAFEGVSVPVFGEGSVPENYPEPYVIITTFTSNQRFVDKSKVFECTQLVDIVDAYQSPEGFRRALTIADAVENLINPDDFTDVDIRDYGYRIGNTFAIESKNLHYQNDTKYVYRVLKRYRHLVSKEPVLST